MDDKPITPARDFPPDMVNAVSAAAARDADAVGLFLRERGLTGTPEKPLKLPAGFLLELAAALRLSAWETQGFSFHHAAGLPRADQAIRDVLHAFVDLDGKPTQRCSAVLRLAMEHLAWIGLSDWNADIALEDLGDETALDVLAEFLWTHRQTAIPKEDCLP
jgi:hypothetical protein